MAPPQTPASGRRRKPSAQDQQRAHLSSSTRQSQAEAPASSQFAPTPRFSFTSNARASAVHIPSLSSPLATRARQLRAQAPDDDIDDNNEVIVRYAKHEQATTEDGDRDEMLLDSIEGYPSELKRRHPSPSPPITSTSRKRTHTEPILLSSSPGPADSPLVPSDDETDDLIEPTKAANPQRPRELPTQPTPSTPARSRTGPRFKLVPMSTAAGASTPVSDETSRALNRAHFVLPAPSQLEPTAGMLPLLFSPQRRGQKYVSGGLAETVRDWVLEAGGELQMKEPEQIHARKIDPVGSGGAILLEGHIGGGENDMRDKLHNFLLVGSEDTMGQHALKVNDIVLARLGWQLDLTCGQQNENGQRSKERQLWHVAWGPL